VPIGVTGGQSVQTLLANAIALTSVGVDDTALQTAIAATQLQLDRDAVKAQAARLLAARASDQAANAEALAARAQQQYRSLDGAIKSAVLLLYTIGPAVLTVNPAAGDKLAYAADYADTAITPNGLLATRRFDANLARTSLAVARKSQQAANRAAAQATAALQTEQDQLDQLAAELHARAGNQANQVLADHAALAAQAGNELASASALQFTPGSPVPPPLATTSVALAWAFAELGKPYVWAATGPNSFDCSGLTQFVWRKAGVSIPRVAADQDAWTIPVPLSQLLPGDLVFFGKTDIHHVGIYIGDGLMINAPHTGDVVRVSSIWWSDLAGFGRVHAAGVPVPAHQPPTVHDPATPVVVPTAGPVPSQTKPPAGWKPKPGSSTPFKVYPAPKPASTTTSTTTPAPSTSTTTSTTVAPTTTTSTTTTSTTTTTLAPTGAAGPAAVTPPSTPPQP
jgi:cell wall-associated NlpC family hydrolase